MQYRLMLRFVLFASLAASSAAPASAGAGDEYQVFDEGALHARLAYREKQRYDGLRCILNDHQRKQYLSLPTRGERDVWIERFWIESDPTPTTRRNELRIEHEARVAIARERFACPSHPPWDDRGEMLIRFGEPDSTRHIWAEIGRLERRWPGEIWQYYSPEMIVTFTDTYLSGRYIRSTEPAGRESWTEDYYTGLFGLSSRMILENPSLIQQPSKGNAYASDGGVSTGGEGGLDRVVKYLPEHVDPDLTDERNILNPEAIDYAQFRGGGGASMFKMLLSRVNDDFIRADRALYEFHHQVKTTRFITRSDLDLSMRAFFDIASFRAGPGKARAEVDFEIPLGEVAFDTVGTRLEAGVELRVAVRDVEYREAAARSEIVRISVPAAGGAKVPIYIPGRVLLTLDPGYYRFGIETVDMKTGRRGVFRTNRRIGRCEGFSTSDIQFARRIIESDLDSRYRKGNLIVVPYPLHVYRKPHPLVFYFEIYGLGCDPHDRSFYEVEYSIVPTRSRRRGPVFERRTTVISSSFRATGFGPDQPQRLEIDTGHLWEGPFALRVRVTDRRTRETIERVANFSILEE
ncbi:MAG: GWxTD domain-containing protein [Candidatus Krumholzibacteria bacterium]|nr:GWxTD domain-containing protein [Candidatus Krumholzibacteria bacterium]